MRLCGISLCMLSRHPYTTRRIMMMIVIASVCAAYGIVSLVERWYTPTFTIIVPESVRAREVFTVHFSGTGSTRYVPGISYACTPGITLVEATKQIELSCNTVHRFHNVSSDTMSFYFVHTGILQKTVHIAGSLSTTDGSERTSASVVEIQVRP